MYVCELVLSLSLCSLSNVRFNEHHLSNAQFVGLVKILYFVLVVPFLLFFAPMYATDQMSCTFARSFVLLSLLVVYV